jgi:hypothetical protein
MMCAWSWLQSSKQANASSQTSRKKNKEEEEEEEEGNSKHTRATHAAGALRPLDMSHLHHGFVDKTKGDFGFITCLENNETVFFHAREVDRESVRPDIGGWFVTD